MYADLFISTGEIQINNVKTSVTKTKCVFRARKKEKRNEPKEKKRKREFGVSFRTIYAFPSIIYINWRVKTIFVSAFFCFNLYWQWRKNKNKIIISVRIFHSIILCRYVFEQTLHFESVAHIFDMEKHFTIHRIFFF